MSERDTVQVTFSNLPSGIPKTFEVDKTVLAANLRLGSKVTRDHPLRPGQKVRQHPGALTSQDVHRATNVVQDPETAKFIANQVQRIEGTPKILRAISRLRRGN